MIDNDKTKPGSTVSFLDLFLTQAKTVKPFPILYSRTSTGATQTWRVETDNNKYRFVTGQKGSSNLVTSEWTVCEGKNLGKANETTGESQALKEAKAAMSKKFKSGGYWENEADIDKVRYIEPILAKSYKDYADVIDFSTEEWGAQNKYNGICCLITSGGAISRKGEKFVSIPHIVESLKEFFQHHPSAVLHGELFNDDYRQQLNEIAKLCRKTVHVSSEDFARSKQLIRYYIYDGYFPDDNLGESSPYKNRKAFIDSEIIGKYAYCEHVPTISIHSEAELDIEFKTRLKRGDEGNILRNMNMPYEHKRSRNLLKVKELCDSEAIILDIKEGNGNWAGTGKIITIKWNGKVFDATFKGTMEAGRIFLSEKNKWIGREVTFLYNGLTGLGVPNYARVEINNCLKGDR
jgi:DNA ligase-1